MEQASADPSTLSQETIVENLDPVEAARLSKVRNIGIAVRIPAHGSKSHTDEVLGTH